MANISNYYGILWFVNQLITAGGTTLWICWFATCHVDRLAFVSQCGGSNDWCDIARPMRHHLKGVRMNTLWECGVVYVRRMDSHSLATNSLAAATSKGSRKVECLSRVWYITFAF